MKHLLLLLTFIFNLIGYGQSAPHDFSGIGTNDPLKKIELKSIREDFAVQGSIYLFDKTGKKLLSKVNEERIWRFGKTGNLLSHWVYSGVNWKFALKHEWTLNADGTFSVHLQQFDSLDKKDDTVITGKLLKEEKIQVVNLSQVQWTVMETADEKMVVQLTPSLYSHAELMDVTKLPIILIDPILSDSKGRVWANPHSIESPYVAIKTHLGQVALSYYPFAGAKEIGFASGNVISIELDNANTLSIKSSNSILGTEKKAKVYGLLDLKKRTERLNSVGISQSSEEKEFLQHLVD